ncbi:hypothetical protein AB0C71_38155 [Streptomyces anulatus]|uniref:hypothetical protein n=1 Tax=Streptomyces anulatus TaxID=1892 RepID=UPI0033CF48E0
MEYAKLVAEYLKILIWPGVALTFILLFRAKISSAIGRLNSVDVAGMQASFAEGAEEARQETEELTLTAAAGGEQNTPPEQAPSDDPVRPSVLSPVPVPHPAFRRALDRAHRDPAEAVDMAWRIMEDALIAAIQARGVRFDELVGSPDSFINYHLAVAGMTEARLTWGNLRTLHRTSAHAPDAPTLSAAIAYVESCRSFTVVALEALASAPLPQG